MHLQKLLIFVLISITLDSFADSVPKSQETSGGQIYSLDLPRGVELYSNARLQEYFFQVDFDAKGNVAAVEFIAGPKIREGRNAKLIAASIRKWKRTPVVMNGKALDRSGDYYTIIIGRMKQSKTDTIRVLSGIVQLIESVLPNSVNRELSKKELKKFHEKPEDEKPKRKPEEDDPSSGGLFPSEKGL